MTTNNTNSNNKNPQEQQAQENSQTEAKSAKPEVISESHENNTNTGNNGAGAINYLEEISKYKDNWLRAIAEIDNIKKRTKQDIEKAAFFGIEAFAKDMVVIFEYLSRAAESITDEMAKNNEVLNNAKTGIDMTKKEMLNVLEKHNVKRIDPRGQKFDPNLHQAVAQVPSGDKEPGIVIDLVQAGYIIKDRLLKPAMVVVSV